jgi:hypothetical protein
MHQAAEIPPPPAPSMCADSFQVTSELAVISAPPTPTT